MFSLNRDENSIEENIDQNRRDHFSDGTIVQPEEEMRNEKSKDRIEKMKFFRVFLWYFYSEIYNWKSLAYSIYHLEHLINHLDNYQIKDFIQRSFRDLLDYFTLFLKDLITIQIQSSKRKYIA